jgi:hypothetical protein
VYERIRHALRTFIAFLSLFDRSLRLVVLLGRKVYLLAKTLGTLLRKPNSAWRMMFFRTCRSWIWLQAVGGPLRSHRRAKQREGGKGAKSAKRSAKKKIRLPVPQERRQ